MIFITSTTDKIQLITSAAATVDVMASYIDAGSSTGTTSNLGRQATAISSATTTDIVAAPGSSTTRNIAQITIRNKDASLSTDVTVQLNISATLYELHKVTLGTGDMLQYIDGLGFFTQTSIAKVDKLLYVTADYTNSTTSFTALTGLSLAVKSGKNYAFEANVFFSTPLTTTGAQFAIGGVAMTGMMAGGIETVLGSATAATMSAATATAVDTAIIVQTTGPTAIVPGLFAGWFQPSADGTFSFKGASEVAASALTVKKGSWVHIRETDN